MTTRLIPIAFMLFWCTAMLAQSPKNVVINPSFTGPTNSNSALVVCPTGQSSDAGTLNSASLTNGESNDIDFDTMYLCFNDLVQITHNGDFVFGDPQAASAPGIGYGFYSCPPTLSGPSDWNSLVMDPCIIDNTVPPPVNDIFVATDNANGNIEFSNTGAAQTFFNMGDPVLLWFAPLTLDDFAAPGPENDANTGELGPCSSVSVNEAFAAVYLNEISISEGTNSGCNGTFTITGGLPEFDGSNYASMTMTNVANSSITADFLVNPNPSHGSTVVYSVTEPGMYEVLIEDGKSCGGSLMINVPICANLGLATSQETVPQGGTVCVEISVANFNNLVSAQFSLNWDPNVLMFDQVTNFNLVGLTIAQFGTPPSPPDINPGQLTVSWLDPSFLGTSVPNGTVIFELCLTAVGMVGESTPVSFTSDPTTIIIENPQGNNLAVTPINETVTITPAGGGPMASIVETPSCPGQDNGQFVLTASGGTAPYSFIWQNAGGGPVNGPVNIAMINGSAAVGNLAPGTYSITLSDSTVPVATEVTQAVIASAPQLGANIVNPVQPTCNGDSDGSLSVEVLLDGVVVTNPGPEYSFIWSNTGTTQMLTNIPSGPYAVTVSDANGCEAVASATLSQPAALTAADTTISLPNCPGDPNGLLAVIMQGGTMPYSYEWSSGATNAAAPLLLGDATYFVTVTDDRSCEVIFELFLPDPPAIIVPPPSNIQAVSCFDATGTLCDGQATANASGGQSGTGVYNYIWSSGEVENGVVTSTATALCQGEQYVIVTDGICPADTVFFMVGAPTQLEFDLGALDITRVSCFGSTDGSATVSALIGSGTPPYDYNWSNLTNGPSVNGLAPGTYTVTLSDDKGCETSTSILIPEPDPIQVMVEPAGTLDVSCNDESDGQITVSWTGGNAPGPAMFTWSGNVAPPNSSVASNLDIGLYAVTVTDEKGCTGSTQHMVNQPPPITAVIPTPVPPQCNGFQTVITIDTAFGGGAPNEPFFFSVDNGPQVLTTGAIPVLAGTHTITIIDNRDCQLDTTITINEPQEVVVNLGQDTIIELGETLAIKPNIIFDPAIPIDTFIWSPTSYLACEVDTFCRNVFVSPLKTTAYTLTVFDENGCPGEDVILVEVDKNRNVFIPNVFTPNGDGSNDFFSVFTGAGVQEIKFMQVYDRWGEKLYERNNFLPNNAGSDGWDGTFKGKTMNPGVYVYLIEVVFTDEIVLLYRGDVTILH